MDGLQGSQIVGWGVIVGGGDTRSSSVEVGTCTRWFSEQPRLTL